MAPRKKSSTQAPLNQELNNTKKQLSSTSDENLSAKHQTACSTVVTIDELNNLLDDALADKNNDLKPCSCACHICNPQQTELMSSDDVEIITAFFKAISDPTRFNIVYVLLQHKELSVSEIAQITNMSISAISHQLAILRSRKLVTVKRDGLKNLYALCDEHVSLVVKLAIEHIHE